MKKFVTFTAAIVLLAMPLVGLAQVTPGQVSRDAEVQPSTAITATEKAEGAEGAASSTLPPKERAEVASFLAVSLAFITAISIFGAAYAVAHVGSAAIGAASEKPEMMGRSLVFVALGEGLAIIGLIVAVMLYTILGRLV